MVTGVSVETLSYLMIQAVEVNGILALKNIHTYSAGAIVVSVRGSQRTFWNWVALRRIDFDNVCVSMCHVTGQYGTGNQLHLGLPLRKLQLGDAGYISIESQ